MSNIKINYFVIVIIALLSAAIIGLNINWPNKQQEQINKILARGELRVSTIRSPLITLNNKNEPTGFDYELTKRFADYLGVKLVIKFRTNINQLFNDLENDKADFLAAGLIYNKERLAQTRTGPAYSLVLQQLIYRKGTTRPRSFADLKGKLIVTAGSAHVSELKKWKEDSFPDLTWEETSHENTQQLLEQLSDGKIDYTISDSISVALQQRIHPNLAVAFDVSEERPLTWYLKRNGDYSLNSAMLDFFSMLAENGIMSRLQEKYFSHVGSFDYFDTISFIRAINKLLPTYQPLFEKYAGPLDWQLVAAIAWQESHWDPLATSPTGVRGLMMLTRPTAEWAGIRDRLDPEESVKGGMAYLHYLMDRLPKTIPEDERIWFALAAYNMGYGHILDARKLTAAQKGNPDSWLDVKTRLPQLSKKKYYTNTMYGYARGYEAYRYVENIRRYYLSLEGYLRAKNNRDNAVKNKAETEITSVSSPELENRKEDK
ncbi:cystine transporter subunit [Xenorhabdus mauleonii]|uniref:Membrane-bound lytic murein transglycosylase F n=1 Tax=Xenorhabdus mauleonii TaxID=351675 RepID=A0A1I3JNB8_9GAMM|nr:membrane-bound lytic murein transglycosylase MltF [Xenorhabdus mauleonii]PHM46264.1 cystine transporter subunit [Xenorhabdus mauleonii]SFI61759.1 membrane-bound lytic murein transglycosylase F [Xenorhabdus mauleonii]